jgi:tRNA dimethylallyltransferase
MSMNTTPPTEPTWVLTGPTACGKTAVALALAQETPLEIISVDSALVYRGMDIGTAKPSAAELAQVPHHLIDILDPTEAYSAARFVQDATRLIGEVRARGRTPLLVGGTMLYLKALLDGIDDMPSSDPAVRVRLDARMRELGPAVLHAELASVDPLTAARLAPGDTQRIQRALEVWHSTGRPLSAFHKRDAIGSAREPVHQAIVVSLEPTNRAWLHERVALRYQQMMAAGFIDEVRALRQRPDLHADLPAIRCVGYRQVWEALDAGLDLHEPKVLAEVGERGIAATRQLAKRQLTWLRSMPERVTVACDQAGVMPQVRSAFKSGH